MQAERNTAKRDGISPRHARRCRTATGGRCNCDPTYTARVWDQATGKRLKRTFPSKTAARNWRTDTLSALRNEARAPVVESSVTLNRAADEWLEAARAGTIRNRSGRTFKPSTI